VHFLSAGIQFSQTQHFYIISNPYVMAFVSLLFLEVFRYADLTS